MALGPPIRAKNGRVTITEHITTALVDSRLLFYLDSWKIWENRRDTKEKPLDCAPGHEDSEKYVQKSRISHLEGLRHILQGKSIHMT